MKSCKFEYLSPLKDFNHENRLVTPEKIWEEKAIAHESTKEKQSSRELKKFRKSVWTKQEDQLLKLKVQERGPSQWAQIALFLPNRSGKQCRQRWHNHLREGVTKHAWNVQQYWILALCVRAFGRKWSAISEFIPGRSDNTIKNQWNCKMKPYKLHFEAKINKLLRHPQNWGTLKQEQQILLKIILRKQSGQGSPQSKLIKEFMDSYCNLLEQGLQEYLQVKLDLQFCQSYEIFLDNPQNDVLPGDLSAAISAQGCMFMDSEQQNAIMPRKIHHYA